MGRFYSGVVLITRDDLARARLTKPYRAALWVGRLFALGALGWLWLLFGVRPIAGTTVIPYWLGLAAVMVVAQVLLSRAGLPFRPRFFELERYRWVEAAFWRDVLWLPGR